MNFASIVGCGITGAIIARELAEKGFTVDIYEKRSHIGGNLFDFHDEHGILVHKYGPHTFHTNNPDIVQYIEKYEKWIPYRLLCGAVIDDKFTPTPFNFSTIDQFFSSSKADLIKSSLKKTFPGRTSVTVLEVLESENLAVKEYGEFLFKKDYSLYTAKQWGVSPFDIDPSVLRRVPLKLSYEIGYFDDKYQLMPENSFTVFVKNILNHKNIKVHLNTEALKLFKISADGDKILFQDDPYNYPLFYTGPIDELFCHCDGRLPYRSLRFEWFHSTSSSIQPVAVVAYPQAKEFTRIVEFTKLPYQNSDGSTYEVEYPLQYDPKGSQEPYYPVLTAESQNIYQKYCERAAKINNLFCCGRLGSFKYFNIDQAIFEALSTSSSFLKKYV